MSSPLITPFIPPLSTPEGRTPPVIPASAGGTPSWTNQHLPLPNTYPMYPPTPYNPSPFIPQMSVHGTPMQPPGSYFPPPVSLPPTGPPAGSALSGDYTGYPQYGQPWGPPAPPPASMYPQTPGWGPMPQPGWGPQPYPPFQTPYGPPMGLGNPAMGNPAMGNPAMGNPAMGNPAMGMGNPAMGNPAMGNPAMGNPALGNPAMGGGMGGGMGWGPPPAAYATPAAGFGGAPLWPPQSGWAASQSMPEQRVPQADKADKVDRFAVGKSYGPVLEPFLVKVVRTDLKINPLLEPQPEDTERVHLKWNMLYTSAHCLRSTDPPHRSWSEGRNRPATFPRVTQLRIVSSTFPWMINIHAQDKSVGVCCGEVIDGIANYLQQLAPGEEYKSLPAARRKAVREAYMHNRAPAHGVPGGALGEGLRRLDWLCQETMYGGIERNDSLVRKHCGDVLPCTVVLNCVHRYPLTEREIQEQAQREQARERSRDRERERERQRRSRSRSRSRPRSRHDHDDDDSDDDDDDN